MASQGRRISMIVGAALLVCGAVVAIVGGPRGGPQGDAADRALAPGAGPRLADATSSETGRGRGSSRDLLAKPAPVADAASLVVKVVDVFTRQPVPGVEVELERPGGGSLGDAQLTDAHGRAVLGPVPEAHLDALVLHVECPQAWPNDLRVPVARAPANGVPRPEVEIEIRSPRTIRGVVVDGLGRPVAGATVTPGRVLTDELGQFQLDSVDATRSRLTAKATGHSEGSVELRPQDVATRIVLGGSPPDVIVRVVGPTGNVPARASFVWLGSGCVLRGAVFAGSVHLDPSEGPSWIADAWLMVGDARDADGDRLPWAWTIVGPIHPGTRAVDVTMERARTIEGQVLDPIGRPLVGAVVVVEPAAPSPADTLFDQIITPRSLTDERGGFVVHGLAGTPYRIHALGGANFTASADLIVDGGARSLVLRAGVGAEARVQVLDEEGRPVSGARLTLTIDDPSPDSPTSASSSTDGEGNGAFLGLSPTSRGTLVVSPPAWEMLSSHVELGWSPRRATIRLESAHQILGTVTSPGGVPLEGVTVAARGGARHTWQKSLTDGSFRLGGFPAGPVKVWAYFGDLESDGPESSLPLPWLPTWNAKAGDAGLRLSVEPGGELTVLVPDLAAGESEGMGVLCPGGRFDPDGRLVPSSVEQDGVFRFRGLVPGAEYTLWAHAAGPSRSALVPGLRAGSPRTVSLSSSVTLRGRLTGAPALRDGAVIAHLGPLRPVAYVEPDGTFEFSGLPPGTYDVEATGSVPDHGEWSGTARATVGTPVEIPMKHTSGPR